MKTNLRFLPLILILILLAFNCSKDDDVNQTNTQCPNNNCLPQNFENITHNHVVTNNSNLSQDVIIATNSEGNLLETGDVIMYKTNEGRVGKLEILNIDDSENKKLTIKAVTFNTDGTIYSQTNLLEIRGTWYCDLDAMLEEEASPEEIDFWWLRINETDTHLTPQNEAEFYKYPF